MNRERRKELAKVFFDVAKYLLATLAIGGFLMNQLSKEMASVTVVGAAVLLTIAYFTTPKDKE